MQDNQTTWLTISIEVPELFISKLAARIAYRYV